VNVAPPVLSATVLCAVRGRNLQGSEMRIALALLGLLLLDACSNRPAIDTSAPTAHGGSVRENFIGPNGRQGYGLYCISGMAACFDDARKICANGFAVIGTSPLTAEVLVECN
jgi:hypothetical protein